MEPPKIVGILVDGAWYYMSEFALKTYIRAVDTKLVFTARFARENDRIKVQFFDFSPELTAKSKKYKFFKLTL